MSWSVLGALQKADLNLGVTSKPGPHMLGYFKPCDFMKVQ